MAYGRKQSHKQKKGGGERERERERVGGGGEEGEIDTERDVCHYIHFPLFYNPDCLYVSTLKINAHVDVILFLLRMVCILLPREIVCYQAVYTFDQVYLH